MFNEMNEMKRILATTSHANVQLKKELDVEKKEKDLLYQTNQRQKKQMNM